jgi:para-nitrobenzyl esterase
MIRALSASLALVAGSLYALDGPVRTESGLVQGAGKDVVSFKGIPFAAAPAGDLRWRPPQPRQAWQGVRQATEFGPACPQDSSVVKVGPQGEDCLVLNIWTPARTGRDRLPVMVSIHGGGFFTGAGSLSGYDGEALARQGAVVVTINYRVGVFGFLAHPELSKESARGASGNYGLLDQIAALAWVKRNIAAFGGDSKRVTIMGESAGGSSVCLLMISPLARGLFQRAISQSAAWVYTPTTRLRERWYGRAPAEESGARLGPIAALRAKPAQEVVKLAHVLPNMLMDDGTGFLPVVDGWVIPDDPDVLYESGRYNKAAFLAGTNADEGALVSWGHKIRTLAALKEYMEKRYGGPDLLSVYPAATDADASAVVARLVTDTMFLYGTHAAIRAVARRQPAYWYHFTRVNGIGKMMRMGAGHGLELNYTFGNLSLSLLSDTAAGDMFKKRQDSFYDETDRALARTMSAMWVQFARTGDPNGPGLPAWPRYRAASDEYLEFGDWIEVKSRLRADQLKALARYFELLKQSRGK